MDTPTVISSQRFLDDSIVEEKIETGSFDVLYVEAEYDDEVIWILVDGHHRLAAAKEMGVEPAWTRAGEMQNELDFQGLEWFLDQYHGGDDYYDITTGNDFF